jgi:uncharacterized protein YktA (UPF0223 family)
MASPFGFFILPSRGQSGKAAEKRLHYDLEKGCKYDIVQGMKKADDFRRGRFISFLC